MLKYVYHHCLFAQRHPFCAKNNKIITCLLVKIHAHFVVFVQCLIYFRYFSLQKSIKGFNK